METCRKCRWARVDVGDPTKGVCIAGRRDADEKETTAGVAQAVIPGKLISLSDKACDKFEPKGSKQQYLKDGM